MDQDTTEILIIVFSIYGALALLAMANLFAWSFYRWPGNSRDGGFIIISLLGSIVLGAIWPVSVPAIWITLPCVDSKWSCFGLNSPAWKAKKQARKILRAQEIEMDRMERAQQDDETRRQAEQEEYRKLDEAKERMRMKRESMLGRGMEETSCSSRSSASNHDSAKAVTGVPDATTTRYWNN